MDWKGANYMELILVLINVVQEQQEAIEQVEARIAELGVVVSAVGVRPCY